MRTDVWTCRTGEPNKWKREMNYEIEIKEK